MNQSGSNIKTLVFISTHVIKKSIIEEYEKLKKSKKYDYILVIDNTNIGLTFDSRICTKNFYGKDVKCFIFDEEVHKELKLPYITFDKKCSKFSEVMWYNADYRFYYVKYYFPNYDYYWQFDYDVFCNDVSYKKFLDKYENKKEDLLITDFRPIKKNASWYWAKDMDWIYNGETQIFGSFFPVCRLSNLALDFLYKRRLVHGEIFSEIKIEGKRWLNCEVFVPTELMENNFSCDYIDEKNVTLEEIDLNEDRIFERLDGKLYHPVKGDFLKRLQKNSNQHICINFLFFKICFKQNKLIYIKQ